MSSVKFTSEGEQPPKKGGIGSTIRDLSGTRKGRTYGYYILTIVAVAFVILIVGGVLLGSVFQKPVITNPQYNIGYYTVSVYARDSNGTYDKVSANVTFVDYYNETNIIDWNQSADGTTIYHALNVTFAVIMPFTFDGMDYAMKSTLLYANSSVSSPYPNNMFIDPSGKPSEFSENVYQLNGIYGNYNMANIVAQGNVNFTMTLNLTNSGNGSFGQITYIPEYFRYNTSIMGSGLWMKCNTIIDRVYIGSTLVEDIYYDGLGNTYILMNTVYEQDSTIMAMSFTTEAIPTQITFINGQWDGTVVGSIT